ncbi:inactive pancreatic lipase-related protein 1-like [Brienomyrus brachyistius]|uniref:inactive pancreatic lipase-related protein 1-like n=1 Tax=Brienomyrus brachyistius TaxID=42636 RepID=UPI0020B202D2|nr:inactive pancreatic lipase-related protein 1-like [Brienomyrus brachyistius]
MLLVWSATLLLLGFAQGAEVCYENLGCFTDDRPWSDTAERPIARLPWDPEKIGTRFLLFTAKNPDNFQEISTNKDILLSSNYEGGNMTRFIIHGFIDQGEENWLLDMCRTMLLVEDINCICVDWKRGGRTTYTQAANNIRVVGAEVAYMIELFQTHYKQKPEMFHVIGHSLGAHCAGEVGRRVPNLGRVTGLDPAEPYFQGCPELVRLDPSDAKFVDTIHTDSLPMIPYLGFGMAQAVGHLDFYPNGGKQMPGCDKNILSQIVDIDGIWEGTRDFAACNHLRSYKFYNDTILNPEGFLGYPCSSDEVFDEIGRCFPCPTGTCPFMGHHADKFKVPSGQEKLKFYLNTGEAKPFARYRYMLTITISGDRTVTGFIKVALYGSNGNSRQYDVHSGLLSPGKTYEVYIDTEIDVGEVTKMKFLWNNKILNPLLPKFGATKMVVQRGKDRKLFEFCGEERVRENVLQTLNPCTP